MACWNWYGCSYCNYNWQRISFRVQSIYDVSLLQCVAWKCLLLFSCTHKIKPPRDGKPWCLPGNGQWYPVNNEGIVYAGLSAYSLSDIRTGHAGGNGRWLPGVRVGELMLCILYLFNLFKFSRHYPADTVARGQRFAQRRTMHHHSFGIIIFTGAGSILTKNTVRHKYHLLLMEYCFWWWYQPVSFYFHQASILLTGYWSWGSPHRLWSKTFWWLAENNQGQGL